MPLDLAEYDLTGIQLLRIALLQELLDRPIDPRTALDVAREVEAWIVGKVDEEADMFQPHLLRDAVRPLVVEMLSPDALIDLVKPLVGELMAEQAMTAVKVIIPPVNILEGLERPSSNGVIENTLAPAQTTAPPASEKSEPTEAAPVEAEDSATARPDDEQIKAMYLNNKTSTEIGDKLNLSAGYVRSRISDMGLPKRKPGPASFSGFREPTGEPAPRKSLAPSETTQAKTLIAAFGTDNRFKRDAAAQALGKTKDCATTCLSVLVSKGAAIRPEKGVFIMLPLLGDAPPQQRPALTVIKAPEPIPLRSEIKAPAPFNPRSGEARSQVDEFIATNGVSTAPNFGFPEIDKLYPEIRLRGHSLARTANKRAFLGDGYKTMTYAECLAWMQDIVKREPVMAELIKLAAADEGAKA